MQRLLDLSGSSIGDEQPCFITFEAGPTHDGLSTALKLVDHAASAGAQAIKFQIFSAEQLVADKEQLLNIQFFFLVNLAKQRLFQSHFMIF